MNGANGQMFGVRSIPNKQQCERWRNLSGAMPA